MNKEQFLLHLKQVERLAQTSKLRRCLHHPLRYAKAIASREWTYRRLKKETAVKTNTFFGQPMQLLLPSSTDIYLTGGKTHHSEIRLARLLIERLQAGDTFIDVGAHYGYFSLLASELVGAAGRVDSFEAAPKTFRILNKNAADLPQFNVHHRAVSNEERELTFYEFPNLYSEYNTLQVEQFEEEEWFQNAQPQKVKVPAIILDNFLAKQAIIPTLIKIDVEGAELQVLQGLHQQLTKHQPTVVMEYLSAERGNEEHRRAEQLMHSLDYDTHLIEDNGSLTPCRNVAQHLAENGLESDNVVFVKA